MMMHVNEAQIVLETEHVRKDQSRVTFTLRSSVTQDAEGALIFPQSLVQKLSRAIETAGLLDIVLNRPGAGKVGDVGNVGPLQKIGGCIKGVAEAGVAGESSVKSHVACGDGGVRELYTGLVIEAAIFEYGSVPIGGELPPVRHDIGAVTNAVLVAGHVLHPKDIILRLG